MSPFDLEVNGNIEDFLQTGRSPITIEGLVGLANSVQLKTISLSQEKFKEMTLTPDDHSSHSPSTDTPVKILIAIF